MADETNYRPLEGVKVLELSTMVAAGSCGRMLADWGATVIKVEAESGDMFRNFPKTFLVPCTMDENPECRKKRHCIKFKATGGHGSHASPFS